METAGDHSSGAIEFSSPEAIFAFLQKQLSDWSNPRNMLATDPTSFFVAAQTLKKRFPQEWTERAEGILKTAERILGTNVRLRQMIQNLMPHPPHNEGA